MKRLSCCLATAQEWGAAHGSNFRCRDSPSIVPIRSHVNRSEVNVRPMPTALPHLHSPEPQPTVHSTCWLPDSRVHPRAKHQGGQGLTGPHHTHAVLSLVTKRSVIPESDCRAESWKRKPSGIKTRNQQFSGARFRVRGAGAATESASPLFHLGQNLLARQTTAAG